MFPKCGLLTSQEPGGFDDSVVFSTMRFLLYVLSDMSQSYRVKKGCNLRDVSDTEIEVDTIHASAS